MKKNKFYTTIVIIIFSFISCNNNNLEKGNFYSEYEGRDNKENSYENAKNLMYGDLAKYMGEIIDRDDYEVVRGALIENNIIDFSNAEIKHINKKDLFITKIKVKDNTIKARATEALMSIKKEGIIEEFARAYGNTDLPEADNLSAYVRATIERSALSKANIMLYNIIINKGIDVTAASKFTNKSYIIEETYSDTEYNVVIETMLN